jgi:hypothetical protein
MNRKWHSALNAESMFIERRPPVALIKGERPAGA